MTNTLWSKWAYEDKDLSDIPNAVGGYRYPNCGRLHNMESVYEVDGVEYNQRGCVCANCNNDKNWNNG